ncbi:hypothetical protein PMI01_00036 [Caulobacter sp. AP07]|uniref:hypothetical protein n=1 Tax=Caulobacter sp. AP07 TaxID=1144304 RepID=UPI000271E338|nr:hypothetical protein [Caulobacter sp. AP07]EJL38469.1 hypothetical protein PMI01_00036 [Caulobacter sp. AP07]
MTEKVARPVFQPAPRPRPINDGAATEALKEATRDLGFGRASSGESAAEPVAKPAPPAPAAPAPVAVRPEPARAEPARADPKLKAAKPVPSAPPAVAIGGAERATSIKFEIDDALSTALKFEALRRRVTVKYLILEALAAKDFPVDLANLPADGRRVRK